MVRYLHRGSYLRGGTSSDIISMTGFDMIRKEDEMEVKNANQTGKVGKRH